MRHYVLVDTSVWIDHLHKEIPELKTLLEKLRVFVHPFVEGELALGRIKDREEFLKAYRALPCAMIARSSEIEFFIEKQELAATGLGLVDTHLLASCMLDNNMLLWTHDKQLAQFANRQGLAYKIP